MEIFKLFGSIFVDTDKADKSIQKTEGLATKLGKGFQAVVQKGLKIAAGVGAAATAVGTAITVVVENTREYRNEMAKLDTAFQATDHSAENARTTYQGLQRLLGETEQAVEAASHLAELCDTQEQLATWTDICTGVYAKFGASLPVEGLTEAANETAKTGALTGALADALNWAGVNEEAFQESLDKCNTEQKRQQLITETLNGLYKEAAELYKQNNKAVLDANEAQEKMNAAVAKFGEMAEPVVTKAKVAFANFLTNLVPIADSITQELIPGIVEKAHAVSDELHDYVVDTVYFGFERVKESLGNLLAIVEPVGECIGNLISEFMNSGAPAALMRDAVYAIEDALTWLADKIDVVAETLKPLIDTFTEYVNSGQAAEDITKAIEEAAKILNEVYEVLSTLISDIIQGFKDTVEWGKEHETVLLLVATAVGTLTTAIMAYNIAQAIKRAGGLAEIVELGILQVQIWALTAAEPAHTAATTLATTATTAFGAVMAFITSPITLVIAAIGALIAIGIALYKNWDVVKEKATELWTMVTETFEKIKTTVGVIVEAMSIAFKNAIDGMKVKAVNTFKDLVAGIAGKVQEIKDGVSAGIEFIKGLFDFEWSLPKIELPHFSISGGFSLNPLEVPSIGVEWFAKAMNQPMILDEPTIFGMNAEGEPMGAGEAGSEVVSGTNTLMNMISSAIASQNEALIAVLYMILEAIIRMDQNMGGNLREALVGMSWKMNDREVARWIREVLA